MTRKKILTAQKCDRHKSQNQDVRCEKLSPSTTKKEILLLNNRAHDCSLPAILLYRSNEPPPPASAEYNLRGASPTDPKTKPISIFS